MQATSSERLPAWTSRASGKVILLGEHAVVFGAPALAVGIDRGARGLATRLEKGPSKLLLTAWDVLVTDDDLENDLGRALRAVLEASPGAGTVMVEAMVDLPPAGGLGCSAALGVAVARALDPSADDTKIIARTMSWERVFHGNASGVDAAVAASGGCVLFRKSEPLEDVAVAERLSLCVGLTAIPSSTKVMVDAVAALREERRDVVDAIFARIGELVLRGRSAIEHANVAELGRLMDRNQAHLAELAVSSPVIERMCELARGAGALGAKLTGAGDGGSVVALARDDAAAERVLDAWRVAGFDGFVTHVAATVHQRLR